MYLQPMIASHSQILSHFVYNVEVALEFVAKTGTTVDKSNEYSMRETRNITLSLPASLSNNSKRPMALFDASADRDYKLEEYFPPPQKFQTTTFPFSKNYLNIKLQF